LGRRGGTEKGTKRQKCDRRSDGLKGEERNSLGKAIVAHQLLGSRGKGQKKAGWPGGDQ